MSLRRRNRFPSLSDERAFRIRRVHVKGSGVKPRRYNIDLGSHLAECDANYRRLMALAPWRRDGEDEGAVRVVLGDGVPDVLIEVLEQSRHTSVIAMRQLWSDQGAESPHDTCIKVRVYHDAKSAEVIEFHRERGFNAVYDYPNRRMRQPDEKAQINRFLSEFLSICLRHGIRRPVPAVVGS